MKFIYLTIIALAFLFSANEKTVSNITSNLSDLSDSTNSSHSKEYCVVSGEKIQGQGVNYNYLGTDVKFCCEDCQKSFKKDPAKYLKGAALRCPVCDEDDAKTTLSSVSNGTKYYFCSKGCKTKFKKDPQSHLKKYQN